MLYVQFDAGHDGGRPHTPGASAPAEREPPAGATALLRARHLGDLLDGLALRAAEPAIMVLRCAVVLALGPEAIDARTWTERGLDAARGFSLAMGPRGVDGRFPLGIAAFADDAPRLAAWLASSDVRSPIAADDTVSAGDPSLGAVAVEALPAPWPATLASDAPYLELLVRLGSSGRLWAAASRRGARFQVEMVAGLPGLPPLHVIARDPPEDVAEILPPDHERPVALGRRALTATPALATEGPPAWDEPGPCDCGVPPDLCAMKRFRLTPAPGATPSALPGADIFRQLSAAIVDLHEVRASGVAGILPGDRVIVARSPECLAELLPGDTVLDAAAAAIPAAAANEPPLGLVLAVLPWPALGREGAFRRTFSGLW